MVVGDIEEQRLAANGLELGRKIDELALLELQDVLTVNRGLINDRFGGDPGWCRFMRCNRILRLHEAGGG